MKEQVKGFLKKLEQEETLKKRFKEADTAERLVALIKEAGFSFGLEEYQQVMKELQSEVGIEQLTDDDMDKVAGGWECQPEADYCNPTCRPGCKPACKPWGPCEPSCPPCIPRNR